MSGLLERQREVLLYGPEYVKVWEKNKLKIINAWSHKEFKSKLNDTDISEDDEDEDDDDEVLVDANAIDQIVGGGVILVN